MAGISEVCSHVAALLFTLEHSVTSRNAVSVTDVIAAWAAPSTSQVSPARIVDMKWKRKPKEPKTVDVPPIEKDELKQFLHEIEESSSSPALMRIVEPFASKIEENSKRIVVPPLTNIYKEEYMSVSYIKLLEIGRQIDFAINESDRSVIEEQTRKQHDCLDWYEQRAGRITASNFKACVRTNVERPSVSLIKTICYPMKVPVSAPALRWGRTHENVAVKAYRRAVTQAHRNFQINEVGLVVSLEYPQLSASPDRLIYCECCSGGCLEIKCPYLVGKGMNLATYAKRKNTCLISDNSAMHLDKSHSYYYQIQMQMFVTRLQYCDFVVWGPKEFFTQRILKDEDFLSENIEKALEFHASVVVPELLGRFFTQKVDSIDQPS